MKRVAFLWGPVLAWAGLIFFLSSLPDLSSGLEHDLLFRKVAHMVEYDVLAALLWRALGRSRPFSIAALFVLSFSLSVLYAASDEWHQSFVPGRQATVYDVMSDAAGAALGLLVFWFLARWRSRRSP